MTTTIGAAIAAAFLAIGILVGGVGVIVIRDATTSDHMARMSEIASMMSTMGDGHMAGRMGAGSPMGPNAQMSPTQHELHHAAPSPEATR